MSRFFVFSIIVMAISIVHIVCPKPPVILKELKPATNRSKVDVDNFGKFSSIQSTEKNPVRSSKATIENSLRASTIQRSKPKKSSTGNVNKRNTRRVSTAGSNGKRKRSPAVTKTKSNKESGPKASETLDTDDRRWILKNFDKTQVDDYFRGNKQWEEEGYYRVFLRHGIGSTYLNWNNKKEQAVVELEAYYNGNIKQKWSFEDGKVVITIGISPNSHFQTEVWTFPQSTYRFIKRDDGKDVDKAWLRSDDFKWRGPEDFPALRKYEKYIKGWCLHNEFFVGEGKGKCFVTQVSSVLKEENPKVIV